MKTIRNILQAKSIEGVFTIHPLATVYEAIALMAAHGIAAVVVTEGTQVAGILSERECVQKVALKELPIKKIKVYEVMDDEFRCLFLDTSVEECMRYMTEKRKRHIPVIENGSLIGLVSIGDVVKEYIANQAFTIDQLQNYIAG